MAEERHPVHRRNVRQAKVDVRPQGGSKRNTRRWCRGVEGREHKPVCKNYAEVKRLPVNWANSSKVLVCEVCNKQIDYYFVSPWRPAAPPPAWVK